MATLIPIPSILSTEKYRHLALQALYQLANGSGSGGGSVTITGSLPAGSNVIGGVGIDQTTPGTTNNVTTSPNLGGLTLATGNLTAATSAVALAAATATKYLAIQNNSPAVIYCNFNAAATTASMQIAAGATYIFETDFLVNTSVNLYSVAGTSAGSTYVIAYA